VIIRSATINDKHTILQLIKELAVYEKQEPDAVQVSVEKIETHGFGKNPYFHTLLVEQDDKAIGYTIYFFTYSAIAGAPVLYVEDLYVEEKYRHTGIGKSLLAKLAIIATEQKCCRMEGHSLTWNEKAIQLYKSIGAIAHPEALKLELLL
jgi:L-amino acid N-acyltransferase YncA